MADSLDPRWAPFVAAPDVSLLALDFDGSLAEIVDDPSRAAPVEGAVDALTRPTRHLGLVAIVTGRPVDFVRRHVHDRSIVVVGQYGLERDEGGQVRHDPRAERHEQSIAAAVAEAEARWPGLLVERKGRVAVTLHWRTAPELVPPAEEIEHLARSHGLLAVPGRMAAELRPPVPVDKGSALTDLLDDRDFTTAAFAGDDHGDLAAFAALAQWSGRDAGARTALRIAVASPESPAALVDAADLALPDPMALAAQLVRLADALEAARG